MHIWHGLNILNRFRLSGTDEGVGPSPAGSSGAIADETDRRVTEECAALQRRLDQLRRRHHQLSQRVHRVQTKSGVEVAYSELKEVVARGQEIFRMPCLMSKSGQLAAQMAQKGKCIDHTCSIVSSYGIASIVLIIICY